MGVAGFILPFIIIFCPAVRLDFSHPMISVLMIVGILAALIILQSCITGYFVKRLNIFERAVALIATGILLAYIFTSSLSLFLIGIAAAVVFSGWQFFAPAKLQA